MLARPHPPVFRRRIEITVEIPNFASGDLSKDTQVDDFSRMPTFLERYQAGDYVRVWADLEALGDSVRQDRYLVDAQAVANETMKRVRHNAEVVVARLESIGYQFESNAETIGDMFEGMRRSMEQTDRYAEFVRQNPSTPDPNFPEFHAALEPLRRQNEALAAQRQAAREMLNAAQAQVRERGRESSKPRAIQGPSPTVAEELAEIEEWAGSPLPLSLRAWCEIVGSVSLVGTHPALSFQAKPQTPGMFINPDFHRDAAGEVARLRAAGVKATTVLETPPQPPLADPLEITCTIDQQEPYDADEDEGFGQRLILGRDDELKAGISGLGDLYSIKIPNSGADARFEDWHRTSFVSYLRIAFEWGGFPGWERYSKRPEKDLAYLREGLLPF
jgi:hypothetical protein